MNSVLRPIAALLTLAALVLGSVHVHAHHAEADPVAGVESGCESCASVVQLATTAGAEARLPGTPERLTDRAESTSRCSSHDPLASGPARAPPSHP